MKTAIATPADTMVYRIGFKYHCDAGSVLHGQVEIGERGPHIEVQIVDHARAVAASQDLDHHKHAGMGMPGSKERLLQVVGRRLAWSPSPSTHGACSSVRGRCGAVQAHTRVFLALAEEAANGYGGLRLGALVSARNAIGADAYDDAVDQGRALDVAEAFVFALGSTKREASQ